MNRTTRLLPGFSLLLVVTALATCDATANPETASVGRVESVWSGQAAADTTIEVGSVPAGAEIYLDQVLKGTTPLRIPGVTYGPHTLVLKLKGYFDFATTLQVKSGKKDPYVYQLTKPAVLIVDANIPQAEVFIDDVYYGRTRLQQQFTPSEMRVRVAKSGYRDTVVVVDLSDGGIKEVKVALKSIVPRGNLKVITIPPQADIYLDRERIGLSTVLIPEVTKGTHILLAKKPGYPDTTLTVNVLAVPDQVVEIVLAGQPQLIATLTVSVDPPTATLVLGVDTLKTAGGKASTSVRPGRYTLKASLVNYDDAEVTLDLQAGKTQSVPIKLLPSSRSNLVYYLVGGGAVIAGGYYLYKKLTPPPPPPVDKYGMPPPFPGQ